MEPEIISVDVDDRIKSVAVTLRVDYEWYLSVTDGAEANLEIQRDVIRDKKAYQTLRNDLARGCVLPAVVLAVNVPATDDASLRELGAPEATADRAALLEKLRSAQPAQVQIIDGLQRTNALRQTRDSLEGDDRAHFLARPLRVEVWVNIRFFALAYRMILLNAGQRPMSIKHQIEIISNKMADELGDVADLEVIKTLDKRRRTRSGQFQLVLITQAFQAWLQGQPNVDLRNVIAEQLLADEAVDTLGESLSGADETNRFKEYFAWLVRLDHRLGQEHLGFLAQDTVIQGLSAAVGKATKNPRMLARLDEAMAELERRAVVEGAAAAFAVDAFYELRKGIDVKTRNVGEATRDLVFRAFSEFIRSPETPMIEHWTFAASAS
jgi:hypothetical protein